MAFDRDAADLPENFRLEYSSFPPVASARMPSHPNESFSVRTSLFSAWSGPLQTLPERFLCWKWIGEKPRIFCDAARCPVIRAARNEISVVAGWEVPEPNDPR
jgi:hypothetical protein